MYSVNLSGNSTLSCNSGSLSLSPECPWIARKYRKCLEELEYWNLFFGPPHLPRKLSKLQLITAKFTQTLPWTFLPSRQILQPHHRLDELYHHVVNFDTSKQPWLNFSGSTSVHFRSRCGIDTRDNVEVGFGRGLAFVKSFPVPLFSTPATIISSDVSVTCLLIPFTMRTQETVWSQN